MTPVTIDETSIKLAQNKDCFAVIPAKQDKGAYYDVFEHICKNQAEFYVDHIGENTVNVRCESDYKMPQ